MQTCCRCVLAKPDSASAACRRLETAGKWCLPLLRADDSPGGTLRCVEHVAALARRHIPRALIPSVDAVGWSAYTAGGRDTSGIRGGKANGDGGVALMIRALLPDHAARPLGTGGLFGLPIHLKVSRVIAVGLARLPGRIRTHRPQQPDAIVLLTAHRSAAST